MGLDPRQAFPLARPPFRHAASSQLTPPLLSSFGSINDDYRYRRNSTLPDTLPFPPNYSVVLVGGLRAP